MRKLANRLPVRLRVVAVLGVLVALLAAAIASGAAKPNKPTKVIVGNLELIFNGGFSPTVLPKNKFAPIAVLRPKAKSRPWTGPIRRR